jgi:hypothetical protein
MRLEHYDALMLQFNDDDALTARVDECRKKMGAVWK